jgi:hypothetical protein
MLINNVSELVPLIDRVCSKLPFRYDVSVRMLMLGTAACESLFTIRKQVRGPARGLWQTEPNTAIDIYKNYLRYNPNVYKILVDKYGDAPIFNVPTKSIIEYRLVNDDEYACVIARLVYARDKHPIPNTLDELAKYYKRVYNTIAGKGSAARFISIWKQLKCDQLIAGG